MNRRAPAVWPGTRASGADGVERRGGRRDHGAQHRRYAAGHHRADRGVRARDRPQDRGDLRSRRGAQDQVPARAPGGRPDPDEPDRRGPGAARTRSGGQQGRRRPVRRRHRGEGGRAQARHQRRPTPSRAPCWPRSRSASRRRAPRAWRSPRRSSGSGIAEQVRPSTRTPGQGRRDAGRRATSTWPPRRSPS